MRSRKRLSRAPGTFGMLITLTLIPACAVLETGSTDPSPAPKEAAEAGPAANEPELNWPDGASERTPKCQDATQAVVDQVNATIVLPKVEGDQVPWLTAHADGSLGKWFLTGVLKATGSESGFFVVWATASDPTAPDFEGELQSVGSSTGHVSSAPRLELPIIDSMQDVPADALICGERSTRQAASEAFE